MKVNLTTVAVAAATGSLIASILMTTLAHAAAPGDKPVPKRPLAAKAVATTNAPPAALTSPVVIKLDGGVTVTVTAKGVISRTDLRRYLREAIQKAP